MAHENDQDNGRVDAAPTYGVKAMVDAMRGGVNYWYQDRTSWYDGDDDNR